jgi:hypothetical protein
MHQSARLATAILLLGSGLCSASGLKLQLVPMSGTLARPIAAAAPAGELNALYIAEPVGTRVKRLDLLTGQLTTVIDLPYTITGIETGLNGLAFHNDKLYVNISGISSDPSGMIKVLEYSRSTTDPTMFDFGSERQILSIENPSLSHNGGWIEFGPHDGLLYFGSGDGGNVPPQETKGIMAQNPNHLWGKILRVDVDGDDFPTDPLRNYAIPTGNPYAEGGGAPEVLALGLRHPFRAGFDSESGDLYIGDVGSAHFEEINFLPADTAGQNYGWRPLEGYVDNPNFSDPPPAGAVDPIHAYAHGNSAAVIGGHVYRGDDIPWLQGTYFFGDYVKRQVHSFRYDGDTVSDLVNRTGELVTPLGSGYGGYTDIAEDASGEMYFIDYNRQQIYKLVERTPKESGDYNNDGTVNAADYTVWRNTVGLTGPDLAADGNGNNTIEIGDYQLWKTNYGWVIPGSASAAAIPEPTTCLLAMAAIPLLLGGRCRRRTRARD